MSNWIGQDWFRSLRSLLTIIALGVAWMSGGSESSGNLVLEVGLIIGGWVAIAAVMRSDLKGLKRWQEGQTEKWEKHEEIHLEQAKILSRLEVLVRTEQGRLNRLDDRVDDMDMQGTRGLRRRKSDRDRDRDLEGGEGP